MIKIGLNGFGRIGRSITRIVSNAKDIKLVVVNEINQDIENLAYLIKYDTIYGKLNKKVRVSKNKNIIQIDDNKIKFFSKTKIHEVEWNKFGIDLLIDATGTEINVINSRKVLGKKLSKVIITHSPDKYVDNTLILGVNEESYNYKKQHIISSSICDASAIGPVLSILDRKFGIQKGFITTLHPRLSYQNLMDGSLQSVSSPGHNWKDYSLGRDSIANLIPKNTTAIKAVNKCLKNLVGKIDGISFRVPTAIVCGSDLTIELKKEVTVEKISQLFKILSKKKNSIFGYQEECLVSIDHKGTTKSVIIDSNYIKILKKRLLKMVIWYDNEWGYSNRVLDISRLILKKK